MIKKSVKLLIYSFSMLILFFAYNNCTPSFQSISSANFSSDSSNEFSAPLDNYDNLNTAVIDDRGFHNKVSVDSSGNVSLVCSNPSSELSETHASALTQTEVKNTLLNTLDINVESSLYSFTTDVSLLQFNENHFTSLDLIANDSAEKFISSLKSKTNRLWSCDFSENCTNTLLSDLPNYIWRKQLSEQETSTLSKYLALFKTSNADERQEAVKSLIHFLITSPQFYIKNAVFSNNPQIAANQSIYTTAAKISFALMYSGPSHEVITNIKNGHFSSNREVQNYYINKFDDEDFQAQFVLSFYGSWFGFESLLDDNSLFDGVVVKDFAQKEYDRFLTLFKNNAPFSYIVNDPNKNGIFQSKVFALQTYHKSPNEEVDNTDIVRRGLYLMNNIACMKNNTELPAALESEINDIIESEDFPHHGTNLEKAAYHRGNPVCAVCHKTIDYLAIGAEEVGPFGNFRTIYPDKQEIDLQTDPVTQSSYKLGGVAYDGLNSYMDLISNSLDFKHCQAEHLHNRVVPNLKNEVKACLIEKIFNGTNDVGLKDIIINFIKSDYILLNKRPEL